MVLSSSDVNLTSREGMIKTIWIGDVGRRIVVGPAIGKVYLTAMVQPEPPAQIIMLDINFLKLRQLSIDRQTKKITVYSPPESPAVSLDFRRISGTFDIEFTDLDAMREILACFPISLTQNQDSQTTSQYLTSRDSVPLRSFGSFEASPHANDVDNADRDYNQLEEDIYRNEYNQQELKKDLGQRSSEMSPELCPVSDPYIVSPVQPITETVTAKPARPRATTRVQNVYTTNKRKERLKAATPAVSRMKQAGGISRASSTSSSTVPDTRPKSTTAPVSTKSTSKLGPPQPLEEGYFDRPPPGPATKPPSRLPKKAEPQKKPEPQKRAEPKKKAEPKQIAEPKPNPRKRPNQEPSDGEWEPTSKKTRAVRATSTSKTVTFTAINPGTTTKKPGPKKAQNVRRQSGTANPSQYGPAEIVDDILEEPNENVLTKPSSIIRPILPLSVSSGRLVGSKTRVQQERTTEKPEDKSDHSELGVSKKLNLGGRKQAITITSSSDRPADDEEFSDEFNHKVMEIDNPFDTSREPSSDREHALVPNAPKTFMPEMQPPPSRQPSHLKFSEPVRGRSAEADEEIPPVGRTRTPIPRTRKRSPLVGASRTLNIVHDFSSQVVKETRSDAKVIIRPKMTETDEEGDTTNHSTPTPASRNPVPKYPELVVRAGPMHIFASSDEEYHESIRKEVPKSWKGLNLNSHKPEPDNTRMRVASKSDMRPGLLVRRSQPAGEEIERPNGFYERLLKAGIKLSSTEVFAPPNIDIGDCSDFSMSVSESDLDSESEMEDDSPISKHQRNIRVALREISEVCYTLTKTDLTVVDVSQVLVRRSIRLEPNFQNAPRLRFHH